MLNTLIFTVDSYILNKKINVSLGLSQLQSSILLLNTISLYHIVKCLLSYYTIQQFRKKLFCLLTKQVNRLYDAAILTRCYTQHALRPNIDSEINHIRHFIKIQFVNKGIEFINLPSIFKDKSVISSIPTYLKMRNPLSFVISIINLFVVLF